MSVYFSFAKFYDRLTSNISYSEIALYYDMLIKKHCGKKGILLDLACGTGSLSIEFSKLEYDVLGVDCSEEMLNIAMEKKHDGITFIKQDMTELDLFGTIDVTICSLDSINHLYDKEEIFKAFKKVLLFSNPDALFLFDVNTVFKHKNILADNTFVYELDDVFCVWQNELDGNRVYISLDIFEKTDKNYIRHTDNFSEIAYSISEISILLENAGFEVIACYDYLTENTGDEQCEKLTFAAKKKDVKWVK